MQTPNQTIVRQHLKPYEATLKKIILNAWEEWKVSPEYPRTRYKRTQACVVFERIVEGALEHLSFDARIHIEEKHESVTFLVDDTVLFRFKKANEQGMSSNYPTQLAMAYHDHEQDLFGLPEVQRVEVTYVLNQLQTEVDRILVVGRLKNAVSWQYDILNTVSEEETTYPVLPFTQQPATPPANLVRLKKTDQDIEQKESS